MSFALDIIFFKSSIAVNQVIGSLVVFVCVYISAYQELRKLDKKRVASVYSKKSIVEHENNENLPNILDRKSAPLRKPFFINFKSLYNPKDEKQAFQSKISRQTVP
jgi:hypothetical protein